MVLRSLVLATLWAGEAYSTLKVYDSPAQLRLIKDRKECRVMEFRINTDPVTRKPMVEVWREEEFIAGIYVHEDGMRIVSNYLDGVEHETDRPPSIVIKLAK